MVIVPVGVPWRMSTRAMSVFPAATPPAGTVMILLVVPHEAEPTFLTKAMPPAPGVLVGAGVFVRVGVFVGVGLGPTVGVLVGGTSVFVRVGVAVGPGVGVLVRVGVFVGGAGVLVRVGVFVGPAGVAVGVPRCSP